MVNPIIQKPAVEISNDVRKYFREYREEFPTLNVASFSEDLQQQENKLIDKLTAFWLELQEECVNPPQDVVS